jgi:hypothetical protein
MLPIPALQQILDDHTILRSEVLPTGDNGVNLPVNLKRLIWNAQQLFKIKPNRKAPSGAFCCDAVLFDASFFYACLGHTLQVQAVLLVQVLTRWRWSRRCRSCASSWSSSRWDHATRIAQMYTSHLAPQCGNSASVSGQAYGTCCSCRARTRYRLRRAAMPPSYSTHTCARRWPRSACYPSTASRKRRLPGLLARSRRAFRRCVPFCSLVTQCLNLG